MISLVVICIVLISSRGVAYVEEDNEEYGLFTVDINTSPIVEEEDPCNKCKEWETCMSDAENQISCICFDNCERVSMSPATIGATTTFSMSPATNEETTAVSMSPATNEETTAVVIDFCYEKPCQNGGTCVRQNEGYQCHCLTDYSGKDCNEESKTSRTTDGTTHVSMSPTTSDGTTTVSMSPATSDDTTTESKSPTTSVDTTIVSSSSSTSEDTTTESKSPTTSVDTTIVSMSSTTISEDTTIESKSPTTTVDTTIDIKSTTTSEVTTIDHDLCISSPCLNNGSCISIDNNVRCNCTYPFSGEFCATDLSEKRQSSSNSIVYACTGSAGAIVFVFLVGFSVLWHLKRVKRRKKESYFHNADVSSMESENSRTYII